MTERKLITVRKINQLDPIEGADKIEVATVDGWKVVVRKGEFKEGDLAVYFEIDSFLPSTEERYSHLMKSNVKTFNGVKGHVLRTVKLKGQISQGLLMPLIEFDLDGEISEGDDLSDELGIVKYEPPIPAQLVGQMKGAFPSFLVKTAQERVQNVINEIPFGFYQVTRKLNGTSCTMYCRNGEVGVCSRNIELKLDDDSNVYVKVAKSGILQRLKDYCLSNDLNLAIQGEIMGPSIQSNELNLNVPRFYLFDVFDINYQQHVDMIDYEMMSSRIGLETVPVIDKCFNYQTFAKASDFLNYSESNTAGWEGVVFRKLGSKRFTFKVINNSFLLK